MKLSFTKIDNHYECEINAIDIFNLHIERDKPGYLFLQQRSNEQDKWASVKNGNLPSCDKVLSFDITGIVFPKLIKIVSEVKPTRGSVTYNTSNKEDTLSTPVYLVFTQSSASQLSINWGDGSIAQTSNIAGNNVLSYTYSQAGDYVITLTNNGSQEILLGGYNTAPNITNTSTNLLTPANDENHVNLNRLKRVEHGLHFAITDLTYRMFNNLQSMNIPRSDSFSYRTFERLRVNYLCLPKRENNFIGTNGFKDGCFYTVSLPSDGKDYNKPFVNARLATFIIPKKAYLSESSFENAELLKCYNVSQSTALASKVFYNCKDLKSISITSTVTIIKANALYGCSSLTTVDFSHHTTVPILEATSAFTATNDNLRILVPSTLYETWIAATNWSSLASKIEAV